MKLKRNLFIVFSIFVILFILTLSVKASNEVTLYAPLGASIRATGKAGIRFEAFISDDSSYPANSEHGFYIAKGVHLYSDFKEAIVNENSTINGNNLVKQAITGKSKTFSIVVINLEGETEQDNIDRFTTDLTVMPYIKLSDGSYVFPTDLCTRNIGLVAKKYFESNDYISNGLIDKIVDTVGGQYLDIDESLINNEVNVYVKKGLTAGRDKYYINGEYQENVKFYSDLNEALNTDVKDPVISLLDNEYNEELLITKQVTILGNNAVINGVVNLEAANVVLDSVTIVKELVNSNPVNNLIITNSNVAGEYIEASKRTDLTSVYFTLKCWNLDPVDYGASTDATEYKVTFIEDKNLEYIYVRINCNEGFLFTDDVKVYVNDSLVSVSLYKVNSSTEIMFTMDDPNWTDIY